MSKISVLLAFLTLTPALARFGEDPFALTLETETISPETGGDTSVYTTKFRLSAPLSISDNHIIALTGSHERFMFEDSSFLPFNDLSESSVGLFTLSTIQQNWRLMSITNLRSSIAEGVNPDDAFTLSGIYGAWYSGWKNLIIGPGIGVSTQLDDTTSFFPILFLDWEFKEHWHLSTRPTPGTRFGPGVSLLYQPDSNWALYAGARYISKNFQLKGSDTYEYKTTRLFSTLQYRITDNLSISGTAGLNVGGSITLEDSETDLDPSLFSGIDLSWSF